MFNDLHGNVVASFTRSRSLLIFIITIDALLALVGLSLALAGFTGDAGLGVGLIGALIVFFTLRDFPTRTRELQRTISGPAVTLYEDGLLLRATDDEWELLWSNVIRASIIRIGSLGQLRVNIQGRADAITINLLTDVRRLGQLLEEELGKRFTMQ